MKNFIQKYGLIALTFFTFFVLLGSRALNEPDEGRYSEIASEMIETGNWLVPHLWYLPHLDKPPMTYWLVAASMKIFGHNEWAVRLPLALAGIGGVWAAFLLGCSLGGRRVGIWSALILQSSLLYFALARMLTTDIFVTLFNAWAIYFFWRSWRSLNAESGMRSAEFFKWHLAGWVAMAMGFMAKGPISLAIPLVALVALAIYRWKQIAGKGILFGGLLAGLALFFALSAPWFLAVFQRVPDSAHYMILGQAAGHLLGTTIKNRTGSFFYFFGILAFGLLPWTILLGWFWRRAHWRQLDAKSKDGWVLLNAWAIFTFTLFTFSHAKLPAYILPIFPALAVLLAFRFFRDEGAVQTAPKISWRICLACSLLLPLVFPFLIKFAFHDELPVWLKLQIPAVIGAIVFVLWLARRWKPYSVAGFSVGLAVIGFWLTVGEVPPFQTTLRANQTLKPMGLALAKNVQPGDAVVCWGKFAEGLPFYAGGAISETHRPYLGDIDITQVPFEFPGNLDRLGEFYLSDENAFARLLHSGKRVWVVGFGNTIESFQKSHADVSLHSVERAGRWTLFVNQ